VLISAKTADVLTATARRILTATPTRLSNVVRPPIIDGQQLSPRLHVLSMLAKPEISAKRPPSAPRRARLNWAIKVATPMRSSTLTITDHKLPGPSGLLRARLYEPQRCSEQTPLVVFIHGGGWHLLTVDAYDGLAALVAEHVEAKVLSLDYRLAPEHPFPAAFEDVLAGYRFAVDNAAALGVNLHRISLAGDSAGGNLAAAAALHLANDQRYRPHSVALLYPLVDCELARYRSSRIFNTPLDHHAVARALNMYNPTPGHKHDPRVCLAAVDDVSAMPPTYIAVAGMDVLRDQGEAFGQRLVQAGVDAQTERFDNLPHGYATMLIDDQAYASTLKFAAAVRARLKS
jgi:acetyl esterase